MLVGKREFKRFIQRDDHSCGSRAVQALLHGPGVTTAHWLLKHSLKTHPDHGTAVSRIESCAYSANRDYEWAPAQISLGGS